MPISESDQAKIVELRELVKDDLTPYYDTDLNLLRWLKGHEYNLQVIEPKLRTHLLFRNNPDWKLDTLADQPRDHPIHSYWRAGLTGEAVKTPNVIVNIEQTGANDYWGLMHTQSVNEILRARVYDLECMLREVMLLEEKTGEQASIMYIMDLEGLHFDKNLVSLMTGGLASISAFMADHYVELIHAFVLVGAPSFITALWTVARPLLPERTKNKVKILGSNWRHEILDLAVAESLPSYWNQENYNPFLAHVERPLQYDVESYYKGTAPENAQTLAVGAGKEGTIEVNAQEGARLHWELHADGHFAFAIYYLDDSSKDPKKQKQLVYPIFSKVPGPTIVPVADSIPVRKTGTYSFWISNAHAWLYSLKVRYIVGAR